MQDTESTPPMLATRFRSRVSMKFLSQLSHLWYGVSLSRHSKSKHDGEPYVLLIPGAFLTIPR
jgi:hypothetical protein